MFYYKQENRYEAPKWMEGEYTLKVHGRKITIERLSTVANDVLFKSHATCHKDDRFDIGEGAKVALDRLKKKNEEQKFEIGDTVEIIASGASCATLDDVDPQFAIRYRYGCVPLNGTKGKIVGWYNNRIAYVEVQADKYLGDPNYTSIDCENSIYAMEIRGLKKV